MSLYLQQERGLSPLAAGAAFVPMMATGVALTPLSPRLAERIGAQRVITVGLVLMTSGLIILAVIPFSTPVWALAAVMILVGLAGPTVTPPATTLVLNGVPGHQAGTASGVFNTSRQVGGALAIAVFGALLANRATFLQGPAGSACCSARRSRSRRPRPACCCGRAGTRPRAARSPIVPEVAWTTAERRCNGPRARHARPDDLARRAPPITGRCSADMSTTSMSRASADEALRRLLDQRIAVLDGAWGTAMQNAGLGPDDYRGDRLVDHPQDVTGDPDLLNLTRPDLILDAHRRYLAAGADITTTNTYTATRIGQSDYGLQRLIHEMNLRGAELARQAVGEAGETGGRFVAGSMGPLNVALSLSPRVEDPAYRAVSYDEVYDAYAEQASALAEGGVDLLLIETIFDTLNAKAAIAAARDAAPHLPLWISVTIVDKSGRTLSGQTVEAFWRSVAHANPLIAGVNCSLGAAEIRPHIAELSRLAGTYTACHPNAGLPNAFGGYDEAVEETARLLAGIAEAGLVNVIGSCCGTSAKHTAQIAAAVDGLAPRPVPAHPGRTRFSGLEPFRDRPGYRAGDDRRAHQRDGLARSALRRLIESGASSRRVRERGAAAGARRRQRAVDINMDADLLDSEQAMTTFLNLVVTEPRSPASRS